ARRGGDVAARYGGEEFTIILPNTTLEIARGIAEQIRTAIEDLCMPHDASQIKDIVTASFGVASLIPSRDQTPDFLIKYADKALYKAKQTGRNRVAVADLDE
ncbi:MAG: diguanylate cyclase, partial [Gammaproteobacteria bacterium]|nr:diguanylate cyclase [Gammaproteobacteria bacterium]